MAALALSLIRIDGGTQPRSALYDNVVRDYADAMGAGAAFPPVIVFYDGRDHWLADGFHRHAAASSLGLVEIGADIRQGTRRDAILFSVGANAMHGLRRTNEDKRRAVKVLLADEEWSRWSDHEIARRCAVSHTFVGLLRPHITSNVASERIYVSKAGSVATMETAAIGRKPFDELREREVNRDYAALREARTEEKKQARAVREAELGAKQLSAPAEKFGLIVTDDEVDHQPRSRASGMDRHAANHYPVAEDAHTAAELHERTKDRFDCAAEDCVCASWATVQHLDISIDLMRLRGFRYVSHYVWGKDKIGLGYWNRNKHEILLIGVKGKIPCPAPGQQWASLIIAPRGAHSAKPECFLEMLEAYFPTLPKIELNRRGPPRPGWRAWGNQAEEEVAPAACDLSAAEAIKGAEGRKGRAASSKRRGWHHTEETRAKLSAAHKAIAADPSRKAALWTTERRLALSARMKEVTRTPEYRQGAAERQTARMADPAARAALSARMKQLEAEAQRRCEDGSS
ncbi:MAG: MT-A70 family methyltransferase [Hyphomicrobiales bacterium]